MIKTAKKFKVDGKKWLERTKGREGVSLAQGYLWKGNGRSLMIEIANNKATLRYKGVKVGSSRLEITLPIPQRIARWIKPAVMLKKLRYTIGNWEVDSFINLSEFMLLAESTTAEDFPEWLLDEITTDDEFRSSTLIKKVV